MKLLIHSNAPWAATGYGQQTDQLAHHLRDAGHDVAISAFYGAHGSVLPYDGMKVYPAGSDAYGNDVVTVWAQHHWGTNTQRDGWIITLMDVWVLACPTLPLFNVASWCPVDHSPVPPAVVQYFGKQKAKAIAMSRFGQMELARANIDAYYAPHGIDCETLSPRDQDTSRDAVGIPRDAFVVGMVAANKGVGPSRKSFPQVMQAFERFSAKHSDAILYMHTEQMGVTYGLDLRRIADSLGILDKIVWADQVYYRMGPSAMTTEFMAHMYSALDVLANPSYGEGFGVPIVEAQSCGVPVIVTDFSSMPELRGAGWLVEGDRWWDAGQMAWYKEPRESAIASAMEEAWSTSDSLGDQAREFALQFDADTVFQEHWVPLLKELDQMPDPDVVVPINRAAKRRTKKAGS